MTAQMTESVQKTVSDDVVSIEAIKKAFIKINEQHAANEPVNPEMATEERVEAIKRAIAPLEFEYKTKVQVVVGPVGGLDTDSIAQLQDGQVKLIASLIQNDKHAHDAFYLGVRGLLALPAYLDRLGETVIQQIYAGLDEEQLNTLMNISHLKAMDQPQQVVQTYLAHLASLNIALSFFDRRNSWQRSLVRKLYPKLRWTAEDLQYIITCAVNKWVAQQKRAAKKN